MECEDELNDLKKKLETQAAAINELRRASPTAKRGKQAAINVACELAGVLLVSGGLWWIYPPASLLLVGAWLLVDVQIYRLATRRRS